MEEEYDVLVICPVAMIRYPAWNSLREEACILTPSSRDESIMTEITATRTWETGHVLSAGKKEGALQVATQPGLLFYSSESKSREWCHLPSEGLRNQPILDNLVEACPGACLRVNSRSCELDSQCKSPHIVLIVVMALLKLSYYRPSWGSFAWSLKT